MSTMSFITHVLLPGLFSHFSNEGVSKFHCNPDDFETVNNISVQETRILKIVAFFLVLL